MCFLDLFVLYMGGAIERDTKSVGAKMWGTFPMQFELRLVSR